MVSEAEHDLSPVRRSSDGSVWGGQTVRSQTNRESRSSVVIAELEQELVLDHKTQVDQLMQRATALPPAVTAVYNALSQQTQFASATLGYDPNGNLTTDGTNTYTWDARDRLIGISGGTSATFSYDALDRRIAKTINGATATFLYDGADLVTESGTSNELRGNKRGRESFLDSTVALTHTLDMPRRPRLAAGDLAYHVLNRRVGRLPLFETSADDAAFEKILAEAHAATRVRLAAYCLMPNHWPLLVWPRRDGELSEVLRWITVTHTQRWHAHHKTAGTGPVYQGRFKSFPVQRDKHFFTVARYVERNALRAQ